MSTMHLLGICVFELFVLFSSLASDSSRSDDYYYDYSSEQERTDEPLRDALPRPDMEQRLRSASSVDELMTLIYPSYWATLKCTSKLSSVAASSRSRSSGRQRPPGSPEDLAFSAVYLNLDVLKSIESEWRKTQCIPREVCVDVGREFGAPTNIFYKPPCVSVYRCGGCCHSEDKQCRNISTGYLSKTLFEITVPITQSTKPVTISVANHTQCSCLSRLDFYKQVHSIIRRALPQCSAANSSCSPGETWNSRQCRCVSTTANARHHPSSLPLTTARPQQHQEIFSTDVCGPDKELDTDTCQCVCQRGVAANNCGANQHLDPNTCQCVCSTQPGSSCPPNRVFNTESCQCVCTRTCPRHQPLNKTRCSCECNESPKKCFLKGKRFHRATCSCARPPCELRRPRCEAGFSFSEEVCRCVPSHWRRMD